MFEVAAVALHIFENAGTPPGPATHLEIAPGAGREPFRERSKGARLAELQREDTEGASFEIAAPRLSVKALPRPLRSFAQTADGRTCAASSFCSCWLTCQPFLRGATVCVGSSVATKLAGPATPRRATGIPEAAFADPEAGSALGDVFAASIVQ